MGADERLDLAKPSLSAGAFTEVRRYLENGVVVAAMVSPAKDARDWHRACELWRSLPPHLNLIELLERTTGGDLLVRYAAIDWTHQPLRVDEPWTIKMVATWGLQLTEVVALIVAHVPADEAGLPSRSRAAIPSIATPRSLAARRCWSSSANQTKRSNCSMRSGQTNPTTST